MESTTSGIPAHNCGQPCLICNPSLLASTPRVPYRCPVCEGRGIVSAAFYSTALIGMSAANSSDVQCRSCLGSGIIYS
jgi:hypothetical protein